MREGRCHALLIFGWLTGLLAGGRAEAVNPETLLMPGKLSTAHVKYEETCSLCHDRSDRDKHAEAPCAACPFGNRYKGTPKECVSCHEPDGVHHGERGTKCAECHVTKGWKTSKFDHFKETGFPLEGVHDRIACNDCHRTGNLKDKLPRDCFGCHQAQDSHAGRLGKDCGICHGSERWKPSSFDHTRDTTWPLTGQHEKVACHTCHTANVMTQKLPTECVSCHRPNDVHAGSLGKECDQCHTTQGWRSSVSFDHDLTKFQLVGLHVTVPCEQCHLTRQYREVGHECIDCHKKDDVHKGSLGKDCKRCHSENGWKLWQFDHGKETGFALSGAHGKLACEACHRRPPDEGKPKQDRLTRHEKDDVHFGQYGRQCDRCHTTITWKGAKVH